MNPTSPILLTFLLVHGPTMMEEVILFYSNEGLSDSHKEINLILGCRVGRKFVQEGLFLDHATMTDETVFKLVEGEMAGTRLMVRVPD